MEFYAYLNLYYVLVLQVYFNFNKYYWLYIIPLFTYLQFIDHFISRSINHQRDMQWCVTFAARFSQLPISASVAGTYKFTSRAFIWSWDRTSAAFARDIFPWNTTERSTRKLYIVSICGRNKIKISQAKLCAY